MPTIAAASCKLKTLQALARTVVQASGAVQVILFGSVARGGMFTNLRYSIS
jgi:predicted nucleotidyltransferase